MKELSQAYAVWTFLFIIFTKTHRCESAVSTCNARLGGNSGTFTSPNYPNPPDVPTKSEKSSTYPDNREFITCEWEIEVTPGKGIQLKFGDFNINAPLDDCDSGEVEVFSGINKMKSSLDKYCPGNSPDTVTLRNNTASVVFRRPVSFTGRGFLISYIAISPGKTIDDFVTCSDIGQVHVDVESFSVVCPSGCGDIEANKVFGGLQYPDASHLCRAAVHAGVISDEFGGRVAVKRESGDVLYHGSTANNITAKTSAMSDYQIVFPALETCHDNIDIEEEQFSASSYWNTTDRDEGKIQTWLPKKAILSGVSEAWSPDDYTKTQWLQIDLGRVMNITGIITKGSSKPYCYTKSFTIKYSSNSILWHSYEETGQRKPKVFSGNVNFFSVVRNNFVEPTIVASHIRVYPTPIPTHEDHLRYGLKLGLMGCETTSPVPSPPPPRITPKTRTMTTTKQTTTSSPTKAPPNEIRHGVEIVENPTLPDDESGAGTTTNVTDLLVDDDNQVDPIDVEEDDGSGDLNEKSIIIIAIVTALAVTSILLATLVLILVRKRKKEPKMDTNVPKPNMQTNVTYNSGIGMNFLSYNNNGDNKKNKKRGKHQQDHKIEYKNDNYKENYPPNGVSRQNSTTNNRGGVTLQYDQQQKQPLTNGDILPRKASTVPVRASYSANSDIAGPSIVHPGNNFIEGDDDTGSFTTDYEDHEYQVILDPVEDCNNHVNALSSKASTGCSVGARSKASDSSSSQQGAVWGNAGDAWNSSKTADRGQMSSFTPQKRFAPRSGTFSHQIRSHDDETDPLISPGPRTAPPSSNFAASRFSHRLRNDGQTPGFATNNQLPGYSPQRCSSSSGGSSSHSPFDVSNQRYDPSNIYYASVPEVQENGLTNGDGRPPQHVNPLYQTNQQPRKLSYKFPSSNSVEPPLFSTLPNGNSEDYSKLDQTTAHPNGSANGLSLRHSNSRTESLNHAKLRSGYDHLYRNKAIIGPDGNKCVVAMTIDDYSKLDLNTAV